VRGEAGGGGERGHKQPISFYKMLEQLNIYKINVFKFGVHLSGHVILWHIHYYLHGERNC
jgi:hypothetical protein